MIAAPLKTERPADAWNNPALIARIRGLLLEIRGKNLPQKVSSVLESAPTNLPDLLCVQTLRNFIDGDADLLRLSDTCRFTANYRVQVSNHLRHISLTSQIADSEYPFPDGVAGAVNTYAIASTVQKAVDFLAVIAGETYLPPPEKPADHQALEGHLHEQRKFIRELGNDAYTKYREFRIRLTDHGHNAAFPEFRPILQYLATRITTDESLISKCREVRGLNHFRAIAYLALIRATEGDPFLPECGYLRSIEAIQRALEFLDIFVRSTHPRCPPIFHSHRYEYYLHTLKSAIPNHILLPTLVSLNASDLLKVRGVPIGLIGINFDTVRVDAFEQTPFEFWCHDANHSRRMYFLFQKYATANELTLDQMAEKSNHFLRTKLLPIFDHLSGLGDEQIGLRRMVKMLLFEILHEDAQPACADMLRNSIYLRPHGLAPTEKITGDHVVYSTLPGASTLSYLYRKLIHDFYDAPEARNEKIIATLYRKREMVTRAAAVILGAIEEKTDLKLLNKLVSSDQSYTPEVYESFIEDIRKRPLEVEKLSAASITFEPHEDHLLCHSLFQFRN